MTCGVDQTAGKDGGEKVAKCITLLEHAADDTPGLCRTVLERCGGGIAVQTAHGDAIQCPHSQESFVSAAKSCREFEYDEQDVVDHKRPASSVAIGRNPENDSSDRAGHEGERDTPSNVRGSPVKSRRQLGRR